MRTRDLGMRIGPVTLGPLNAITDVEGVSGLEWARGSGLLTSAVAITKTHSLGVVRDVLLAPSIDGDNPPGRCPSSARPSTGCSTT